MLHSASDSHILSHVRSCSDGEAPAAVTIFSSLCDDNADSISFARRWFFCLGYAVFLLFMPNRIFFISASSARILPLNAIMSWRICIIWSPNLDR
jgi:hypothetical protein